MTPEQIQGLLTCLTITVMMLVICPMVVLGLGGRITA